MRSKWTLYKGRDEDGGAFGAHVASCPAPFGRFLGSRGSAAFLLWSRTKPAWKAVGGRGRAEDCCVSATTCAGYCLLPRDWDGPFPGGSSENSETELSIWGTEFQRSTDYEPIPCCHYCQDKSALWKLCCECCTKPCHHTRRPGAPAVGEGACSVHGPKGGPSKHGHLSTTASRLNSSWCLLVQHFWRAAAQGCFTLLILSKSFIYA